MQFKRNAIYILSILCFGAPTVLAQQNQLSPRELEEIYRSATVRVDGKSTPELIPAHIRWDHFFTRYKSFEPDLRQVLSESDLRILADYAGQHQSHLAQAREQKEAEAETAWKDFHIRAQLMSADEIASLIETEKARVARSHEQRYRSVLAKLSDAGRRTTTDFAFAKIRPMYSYTDEFVLARRAPEYYRLQMAGAYYGWRESLKESKQPQEPSKPVAVKGDSSSESIGLPGTSLEQ